MAHTTILRWVQHYTPELEKRWSRFARRRVRGEWACLYRAVDKAGKDRRFRSEQETRRERGEAFLRKVMKGQRLPTKIILDA